MASSTAFLIVRRAAALDCEAAASAAVVVAKKFRRVMEFILTISGESRGLGLGGLGQCEAVPFAILNQREPTAVRKRHSRNDDLATMLGHQFQPRQDIFNIDGDRDSLAGKFPPRHAAVNPGLIAGPSVNTPKRLAAIRRLVLPGDVEPPAQDGFIKADGALRFITGNNEMIDSWHRGNPSRL